jgi:hypothetical protein
VTGRKDGPVDDSDGRLGSLFSYSHAHVDHIIRFHLVDCRKKYVRMSQPHLQRCREAVLLRTVMTEAKSNNTIIPTRILNAISGLDPPRLYFGQWRIITVHKPFQTNSGQAK